LKLHRSFNNLSLPNITGKIVRNHTLTKLVA
jgi:hypothetical protein